MTRLTTLEAGTAPASDLTELFRTHGLLIAALPEDVPDPVDDDDQVWIETLATIGMVGIPHADMAAILGITIDEWLTPAPEGDDDDCDDLELYDDD